MWSPLPDCSRCLTRALSFLPASLAFSRACANTSPTKHTHTRVRWAVRFFSHGDNNTLLTVPNTHCCQLTRSIFNQIPDWNHCCTVRVERQRVRPAVGLPRSAPCNSLLSGRSLSSPGSWSSPRACKTTDTASQLLPKCQTHTRAGVTVTTPSVRRAHERLNSDALLSTSRVMLICRQHRANLKTNMAIGMAENKFRPCDEWSFTAAWD